MMTARERRVLNEAVRRIKTLTKKIKKLEDEIISIFNTNKDTLTRISEIDGARAYEDTEAKQVESGIESSLGKQIISVVQMAMDRGLFRIQRHTHENDNQGGDAFSAKGGYLI